jgi:hypothetical protein
MEAPQFVSGSSQLTGAMGYWPSFHDANVVNVSRARGSITVAVHVFAMTDQVDAAGYYILEKHHLVTLALEGVQSSSLPPDYSSDCLSQLSFHRAGASICVAFESHMDSGGEVTCKSVAVLDVVPCSPAGTDPSA